MLLCHFTTTTLQGILISFLHEFRTVRSEEGDGKKHPFIVCGLAIITEDVGTFECTCQEPDD